MTNNNDYEYEYEYEYDMQLSKLIQEDYTKTESEKLQANLIEELPSLRDDAISFGFGVNNLIKSTLVTGTFAVLISGCSTTSYQNIHELNKITHVKNNCVQPDKNKSPWYIGNLYDCKNKSFFIPYQLWSGTSYDGNKTTSIKHLVDISTQFSYREDKPFKTRAVSIKSMPWLNNKLIYKRKEYKKTYTKEEVFIFKSHGISRIYDNKGIQYGLQTKDRLFIKKHIKFPAGYGWKINELKTFIGFVNNIKRTTGIEIKSMEFNDEKELESITFNWLLNGGKSEIINYKYSRNTGIIHQFGGK